MVVTADELTMHLELITVGTRCVFGAFLSGRFCASPSSLSRTTTCTKMCEEKARVYVSCVYGSVMRLLREMERERERERERVDSSTTVAFAAFAAIGAK